MEVARRLSVVHHLKQRVNLKVGRMQGSPV